MAAKNKNSKVRVTNGGVKGFFERSREHARRLDRGESLAAELTVSFENANDIVSVLSPQRMRVLELAKKRTEAGGEPGQRVESRSAGAEPRRRFAGALRTLALALRNQSRATS